jgi:hypothetical protein
LLKAARDRKREEAGKCEGRKTYAERDPELVAKAKQLSEKRPRLLARCPVWQNDPARLALLRIGRGNNVAVVSRAPPLEITQQVERALFLDYPRSAPKVGQQKSGAPADVSKSEHSRALRVHSQECNNFARIDSA